MNWIPSLAGKLKGQSLAFRRPLSFEFYFGKQSCPMTHILVQQFNFTVISMMISLISYAKIVMQLVRGIWLKGHILFSQII